MMLLLHSSSPWSWEVHSRCKPKREHTGTVPFLVTWQKSGRCWFYGLFGTGSFFRGAAGERLISVEGVEGRERWMRCRCFLTASAGLLITSVGIAPGWSLEKR